MRSKGDHKREAILEAAVRVANDEGLANASMSKIARTAGVSPATLYTYFEGKDDLLRAAFLQAKRSMLERCCQGIDGSSVSTAREIESAVRSFCKNTLGYLRESTSEFLFVEQAVASPLVDDSVAQRSQDWERPVVEIFARGSALGVLRDAPPALLIGFCMYPIEQVHKETLHASSLLAPVDYELVFDMCWSAIRR